MKNRVKSAILAIGIMATLVVNSFAAELPSEISAGFATGLGDLQDQIFQVVGLVFPIALGLVVVTLAITFGFKFIKRITGRA